MRISPELEAVIAHALAKDREQRFQSMAELAQALESTAEMPANLWRESSVPPDWSLVPPPSLPARASRAPTVMKAQGARGAHGRRQLGVGIGLAALLLGLGAMASWRAGLAPTLSVRELPTAVVAVEGSAPPSPGPVSAAEAVPAPRPAVAGEALVKVRVTTKPTGASVRLAGRGEVCGSTPCEFEAQRGEALTLAARRGRMTASAELVAAESTELHLILTANEPTAARRVDKLPGDLKVPAAFR